MISVFVSAFLCLWYDIMCVLLFACFLLLYTCMIYCVQREPCTHLRRKLYATALHVIHYNKQALFIHARCASGVRCISSCHLPRFLQRFSYGICTTRRSMSKKHWRQNQIFRSILHQRIYSYLRMIYDCRITRGGRAPGQLHAFTAANSGWIQVINSCSYSSDVIFEKNNIIWTTSSVRTNYSGVSIVAGLLCCCTEEVLCCGVKQKFKFVSRYTSV